VASTLTDLRHLAIEDAVQSSFEVFEEELNEAGSKGEDAQ